MHFRLLTIFLNNIVNIFFLCSYLFVYFTLCFEVPRNCYHSKLIVFIIDELYTHDVTLTYICSTFHYGSCVSLSNNYASQVLYSNQITPFLMWLYIGIYKEFDLYNRYSFFVVSSNVAVPE